jgi:YVTN family beta-propeller protein
MFLVNHQGGTVTAVGLCPSLHVLKDILVFPDPLQVRITPDGATALVTSYDGAVNFIDTQTATVTFTLQTPNYNPSGLAISPDGTRAYVTHFLDLNPSLLIIDIPNRKILSTIPVPFVYPRNVFLTPDGTQAWVNYYQGTSITIIDLLSATVSRSISFPAEVSKGIAFNPTGTKAFVAATPSQVYVIDTASLKTLANITVGPDPADIVSSTDGRLIFVNSAQLTPVWVIDAIHNTLKAAPASPQPGGSQGLLVFP